MTSFQPIISHLQHLPCLSNFLWTVNFMSPSLILYMCVCVYIIYMHVCVFSSVHLLLCSYVYAFRTDHLELDNLSEGLSLEKADSHSLHPAGALWHFLSPCWHLTWCCPHERLTNRCVLNKESYYETWHSKPIWRGRNTVFVTLVHLATLKSHAWNPALRGEADTLSDDVIHDPLCGSVETPTARQPHPGLVHLSPSSLPECLTPTKHSVNFD